jgi:hypothetical protein
MDLLTDLMNGGATLPDQIYRRYPAARAYIMMITGEVRIS